MGRVINEWVCLPSNCGTAAYAISAQYDAVGHLTALSYPSGRTIMNGYNSAGRPVNSVLTNFGGQSANYSYYTVPQSTSTTSWGYNPNGSLSQGTFGNGITENYGYNSRSQLNAITASATGQTWLSKLYGLYDANGNNNGTIWSIADGISPSRNQAYKYDDVGRVISGSQQDGAFSQTFNYDAWGNMTTSGTNNFNPLYDGNNRIIGAPAGCTITTPYCYDVAGNLLNDGVHQYSYDGYNRTKAVDGTGAIYTYDSAGERVRKDTGGKSTEYINFAGMPIAEKDLSTGYWSDFVFFNGHRMARANNYEHQLHISGQVCANCGSQWYQFTLTNLASLAGRTIQAGDTLRWLQWQNTGSSGGMMISFTDGTNTGGLAIADQNGEPMSRSAIINQWDYRSASLTALAGKQISQIMLNVDGSTQPGAWDIYLQDVVLVSADGSVWPLFSQNPTVPAMTGAGSTGMTSISTSINDCSGSGCAPINTTTYFHGDQIGSARLMSAGHGYPVWQGTFTPFGQEVSAEITTNHYKFNGKERGEAGEGGLDYFGARYYSSVLGRWMTPDWSDAPSAVPYATYSNPQSLNLYGFVTDDPLSHTDLDGHEQFTPGNDTNGYEANKTDSCTFKCELKKLKQWFHNIGVANDRAYIISHCKTEQCKVHYRTASEDELRLAMRYLTDRDFHQQVDDYAQYLSIVGGARPKPPNLPSQNKVTVDVDHSIDGHTEGGARYQQSAGAGGNKDLWPEGYDKDMIEKAIRSAYDNASKVGRQFQEGGDILKLRGSWGGMTIEMWLDTSTNVLRGYPVW
jgi:RHS repeat-associated protein